MKCNWILSPWVRSIVKGTSCFYLLYCSCHWNGRIICFQQQVVSLLKVLAPASAFYSSPVSSCLTCGCARGPAGCSALPFNSSSLLGFGNRSSSLLELGLKKKKDGDTAKRSHLSILKRFCVIWLARSHFCFLHCWRSDFGTHIGGSHFRCYQRDSSSRNAFAFLAEAQSGAATPCSPWREVHRSQRGSHKERLALLKTKGEGHT